MGCICESPLNKIQNTHYTKRNSHLIIIGKGSDKGIVIIENNNAIASFDIDYCPKCGKKLYEGE